MGLSLQEFQSFLFSWQAERTAALTFWRYFKIWFLSQLAFKLKNGSAKPVIHNSGEIHQDPWPCEQPILFMTLL